VTIITVGKPGAVPDLARELVAKGHDVVVAAGGDGTISAAASVLVGSGTVLGILPLGTQNHLAKDLGIPTDLPGAVAVLAFGQPRAMDVGEVNGRTFLNNVSVGLYPAFIKAQGKRRDRRKLARWRARITGTVLVALRLPVLRARIVIDARLVRRVTPMVLVGNNVYRVRGNRLGSRRELDAGRLCVITARTRSVRGILRLGLSALAGRDPQPSGPAEAREHMEVLTGAEVEVRIRQSHTLVAVDGENVEMSMPLRCSIRPGALLVMAPGGGALRRKGG
jgi:diacylglycerol kinase family enzyme